MKNIFIENKRAVLQIARANDVDISVAANLADQIAREIASGKAPSYSIAGVEGLTALVAGLNSLTQEEIGQQMAEYNRQATEAQQQGKPWVL